METNPVPIVAEEKPVATKKGGKGLLITTIVCAVLAVAGVGFGVYGMVKANEKKPEPQPQEEVSDDTKCKVPEKTETTETEEVKPTETQPVNNTVTYTNTAPYIKDNYFYVPVWGLKFKIPEDLIYVGYSVEDYNSGYTAPNIGFTGVLKSDAKDGQTRTFDSIETCAIVNVTKEKAGWKEYEINGLIKHFDGYTLLIWNHSRHGSCDFEESSDRAEKKIQSMFSNPEKI